MAPSYVHVQLALVDEFLRQMWDGPGHFRFYLQPAMAIALAIRDGVHDAKLGRPPYLFWLVHDPGPLSDRLTAMVKHLAVPMALALSMSFIFQVIIQGRLYPLAAAVYAVALILTPYVVVRAVANRLAHSHLRRDAEA